MNTEENNKQIAELAQRLNMKFPSSYVDFLSEIDNGDVFEIEGTGICMYSYADLEERNLTYEVEAFEPNYFMIGQDGDLATLFEEIIPTTTRYIQMILGH